MLSARVVPGLITMATDGEVAVRAAAIRPLVIVATNNTTGEVMEQVMISIVSLFSYLCLIVYCGVTLFC